MVKSLLPILRVLLLFSTTLCRLDYANAFTVPSYSCCVRKNHIIIPKSASSSSSSTKSIRFAVTNNNIELNNDGASSFDSNNNNNRVSSNMTQPSIIVDETILPLTQTVVVDDTATTEAILEVISKEGSSTDNIAIESMLLELPKPEDRIESAEEEEEEIDIESEVFILESTIENMEAMTTEALPSKEEEEEATTETETTTRKMDDFTPSLKRILVFTISATGIFWCSPLLSLIDTSAVGLLSGTAQQAALNPGTTVTDYATMLMAFLYTGATNTLASSYQKDRGDSENQKTTVALTTVMQLSWYVGSTLGTFLFVFSRPILRTLIGNDALDPEVFCAALSYVRIRAIGMPAAAIIGSTQAACLGMQDVKSPLYVLVAAALVNLVGDCCLVRMKSSVFGGAAGAAWATVFSQYAAVGLFVRWLCYNNKKANETKPNNNIKQPPVVVAAAAAGNNNLNFRQTWKARLMSKKKKKSLFSEKTQQQTVETTSTNESSSSSSSSFSTRGLLAGKFKALDLFRFPPAKKAKKYAPFVLPVTATQLGKISGWITMSHVVSSSLGTVAMAANQVVLSLFWCFAPISDSLSLTAQSIITTIFETNRSSSTANNKAQAARRAEALNKSVRNFFQAGILLGVILGAGIFLIPFASHWFTKDPAVIALVHSMVPILFIYFCVNSIFTAGEGLLLGQKDLSFIGRSYATFFFVVPYFMLRVKRAALSGGANNNIQLSSVWLVFTAYQYTRTALFVGRALFLQRRTELEAKQEQ